jgi:hypothetical protein
MWKWLSGREPEPPRGQDHTEVKRRESPEYSMPHTTVGQTFEELKAKGYQGPFAWGCDGIMVLLYHGPNVSLHHDWIEAPDNHFQMQVLDCQTYCRDSLMFAIDKGGESIDHQFRKARTAPDSCCPRLPIATALKIPCLLSYPHGEEKIPEGAQCIAQAMEDRRTEHSGIRKGFRLMLLFMAVLIMVTDFFGGALSYGLKHYCWPQ